MPLFENHVGISVSLDKLRLVELVYTNNEFILENVDELKFDEKLNPSVIDENFVNILQNSFQNILSQNPITSKNISFSLDPEFFQILEVPFEHTLLKEDLTEQFKWELCKVKPTLNPEDHLIQHIELYQEHFSQINHAAVLYLNKKLLHVFNKLTLSNNLKLRYIDYSHSSANIFIRYLNKSYGSSGLSLFITDNHLGLMILEDYKPVVLRKKKRTKTDELGVILNEMIDDLKTTGINLSELSYSYIVGDKIDVKDVSVVNNLFDADINLIDPFEVVKVSDNSSIKINLQNNPSRFASSAGVALRLF